MMNKLLAPLFALGLALGLATSSVMVFYAGRAQAQTVDAGAGSAIIVDSGSGSGSAAPTVQPADKIDPIANPAATFDELKAAKKLGWGILALAILIVACKVLAKLGGIFKVLGTGKVALAIASIGTLAMTAYNAMLLGGTWFAALAAAIVAGFAAWDAGAKQPPSSSSSPPVGS